MTVGELIQALSALQPDAPVVIETAAGYVQVAGVEMFEPMDGRAPNPEEKFAYIYSVSSI